jgi:hypothetical protein
MNVIATTRFNQNTFNENKKWREKHKWEGSIYNTPLKTKITSEKIIFILEMNNDENKIEGVGLVRARIWYDKHYSIYSKGNYNRYTYKSKYRIERTELVQTDPKTLWVLEQLIFKGSRHLKRGQGITQLPSWIANNKVVNFPKYLRNLFVNKYDVLLFK